MDLWEHNHRTMWCALIVGACGLIVCFLMKIFARNVDEQSNGGEPNKEAKRRGSAVSTRKHDQGSKKHQNQSKSNKKSSSKDSTDRTTHSYLGGGVGKENCKGFTHPWLLTTLKGHTGQILDMDYSSNGKYLITCADDRSVLLWDLGHDLSGRKSFRTNVVDHDHARLVAWSPDTRAFIIHRAAANACQVYKVERRKKDTPGFITTPTKLFNSDDGVAAEAGNTIALCIAADGKFVMTCIRRNALTLWDVKGVVLQRIDTTLVQTAFAAISPCGRYVAACGQGNRAEHVKLWLAQRNVNEGGGDFKPLHGAYHLMGHREGVQVVHLAFDQNSARMATVSMDGTWRLFDIKVDFANGRQAELLATGTYEQTDGDEDARVALSPLGETLVVASGNALAFFRVQLGTSELQLDQRIVGVAMGRIKRLLFDPLGRYVLVAGDRHVKVFHNGSKYRCDLLDARGKLQEAQTSATRERLMRIVKECEAQLLRLKTMENN